MKQYISTAQQAFSFLSLKKNDASPDNASNFLAQQSIPAVALLLGFSYFLIAEIILFLSGGASIRSGLLAAIIITVVDAYLDRGQKLSSLSWTGQLLEAWQNKNYEETEISKHYSMMMLNLSLLIKLAAMSMLIAANQSAWLMLPAIFSGATLLSAGCQAKIFQSSQTPFLPWIVAGIATIPCILISQSLVPVILIALITFTASHFLSKAVQKSFNTMNRQLTLALTEFSFIITLLAALLLSR